MSFECAACLSSSFNLERDVEQLMVRSLVSWAPDIHFEKEMCFFFFRIPYGYRIDIEFLRLLVNLCNVGVGRILPSWKNRPR